MSRQEKIDAEKTISSIFNNIRSMFYETEYKIICSYRHVSIISSVVMHPTYENILRKKTEKKKPTLLNEEKEKN
tara:strand:+ start:773 stop:994 length:222 start_codon:yes stop_codon:yes gene_type:complete